jgi:hypothetical protein
VEEQSDHELATIRRQIQALHEEGKREHRRFVEAVKRGDAAVMSNSVKRHTAINAEVRACLRFFIRSSRAVAGASG